MLTATMNPELGKVLIRNGAYRSQHVEILVDKKLLEVLAAVILPQLTKLGLFTAGPFGQGEGQ